MYLNIMNEGGPLTDFNVSLFSNKNQRINVMGSVNTSPEGIPTIDIRITIKTVGGGPHLTMDDLPYDENFIKPYKPGDDGSRTKEEEETADDRLITDEDKKKLAT
ncbi:gp130R [Rabbit fibroma virus]|uniref:Gp130R n=1 Tax=Rabbit fibroma virus (strain Kasza) TaxID=10272 RepID=Q9Q8U8_RFVKA|nr:gp130R [Rabbit fibroma virus]AAF18013.1 gp130R [Rabbit fibroma virus]